MGAHLIDSRIFGHQWATDESRALFDEPARVARWLGVVIALAEAQAECGVIPVESALAIGGLRGVVLPVEEIARRTRETAHSTLGMIQVLRERLTGAAAEHVYYGATVQDVTDTAQTLEIRATCSLLWRDWRQIESDMLTLALQHRATPMPGRTHGQPGAPIAFGLKAATWADEMGRHLQRLRQGEERWMVGQLGGAVGTLAFFGERALPMRTAFCRRLGLQVPTVSWLTSRDRLAEFAHVVAMAVSSLARTANEVYALQRREIGELAEKTRPRTVGSITMPHKRNPEVCEQIVVLARLVRSHAAVLTDTMVQEHERDARGWKAEWAVLPELCHMALAATAMARELVAGLEVRTQVMRRNLDDNTSSERLLSVMAQRVGKHRAQELLNDAYRRVRDEQLSLPQALQGVASAHELAELPVVDLGASAAMVDAVAAAAQRRRDAEPAEWT